MRRSRRRGNQVRRQAAWRHGGWAAKRRGREAAGLPSGAAAWRQARRPAVGRRAARRGRVWRGVRTVRAARGRVLVGAAAPAGGVANSGSAARRGARQPVARAVGSAGGGGAAARPDAAVRRRGDAMQGRGRQCRARCGRQQPVGAAGERRARRDRRAACGAPCRGVVGSGSRRRAVAPCGSGRQCFAAARAARRAGQGWRAVAVLGGALQQRSRRRDAVRRRVSRQRARRGRAGARPAAARGAVPCGARPAAASQIGGDASESVRRWCGPMRARQGRAAADRFRVAAGEVRTAACATWRGPATMLGVG